MKLRYKINIALQVLCILTMLTLGLALGLSALDIIAIQKELDILCSLLIFIFPLGISQIIFGTIDLFIMRSESKYRYYTPIAWFVLIAFYFSFQAMLNGNNQYQLITTTVFCLPIFLAIYFWILTFKPLLIKK